MSTQSKTKLVPLVILGIAILVVAGLIFRDRFALSEEGKIISRASVTDSDGDGLTDEEETKYKTNPNQTDSDGDGVSDLEEIQRGTDPNKADQIPGDVDSDGDGLINDEEAKYGTDPFNPDTDQDGYSDGVEIVSGNDPLTPCEGCEGRVAGDWAESLGDLTEGLDTEALLEDIDTSPVELPEIPDSELNITDESGKEAVRKYFDEVEKVLKEDLPFGLDQSQIEIYSGKFPLILQSQEETQKLIDEINKFKQDIKNIPVPQGCVQIKRTTLQILIVAPNVVKDLSSSMQSADISTFISASGRMKQLIDTGIKMGDDIQAIRQKYNFK